MDHALNTRDGRAPLKLMTTPRVHAGILALHRDVKMTRREVVVAIARAGVPGTCVDFPMANGKLPFNCDHAPFCNDSVTLQDDNRTAKKSRKPSHRLYRTCLPAAVSEARMYALIQE